MMVLGTVPKRLGSMCAQYSLAKSKDHAYVILDYSTKVEVGEVQLPRAAL